MKWIQSHKLESTVIGISVLLFIFILIFVKIFFFSSGHNAYGDRLDGIEDVKLNQDKLGKIESELQKNDLIEKIESHVTGKIVNFMVQVNGGADFNQIKEEINHILDNFNDKEKDFYDMQVYIITKGESSMYPQIGYKGKNSSSFTWMNS